MRVKYKIGAGICIVMAALLFFLEYARLTDDQKALEEPKDAIRTVQYIRPDFSEVIEYVEQLEKDIYTVDEIAFEKKYEYLNEMLMEISTANRALMIERYNDINSIQLINEYEYFYTEYEKLYIRYAEFMSILIQSDKYDCVSDEWSKEEREKEEEVLNVLNEEYQICVREQKKCVQQFYLERTEGYIWLDGEKVMLEYLLESEQYSDVEKNEFTKEALRNYYSQIKSIYIMLIDINNRIARNYGYDNYYDYICSQYKDKKNMSFDSDVIYSWVKTELVPLYCSIYGELSLEEMNDVINKKYTLVDTIYMLETGLGELSPDMRECFENMFVDNRAEIGNQEGKSTNNFTTYLYSYGYPYVSVYLFENYIDQGSILHEFGHYYGYSKVGAGIEQHMDVFETIAQAMNGMYWVKMFQKNGFTSEIKLNMLNILQTVILSALIDEFEKYAYTEMVIDSTMLDLKYLELLKEYGLIQGNEDVMGMGDWADYTLIFESPFYYRNYMFSSIPVLMIMSEGFCSIDEMLAMYMIVLEKGEEATISDVIEMLNKHNLSQEELLKYVTKKIKKALQM